MNEHARHHEVKETPAYQLTIVFHRHGPKQGVGGPLTVEGRERTEEVFDDAYAGVPSEASEGVDVVYSNLHEIDPSASRAKQTADTAMVSMRSRGEKVRSVSADDRLSEGQMAKHEEFIHSLGGRSGKYLKGWMELETSPIEGVKTGKETAAGVAGWVLEKIAGLQESGRTQEIEAFTHGPVLAAFLLRLEELTGQSILPDNWMQQEIKNEVGEVVQPKMSPMRTHLEFLSSFNLSTDARNPDVFMVNFKSKSISAPLELLRQMAGEEEAQKELAA